MNGNEALQRLLVIVMRKIDYCLQYKRLVPDQLMTLQAIIREALTPDPPEPEEDWGNEPTVSVGPPRWCGTLWRGHDFEAESTNVFSASRTKMQGLFENGFYVSSWDSSGWRQLAENWGEPWRTEHAKQREIRRVD